MKQLIIIITIFSFGTLKAQWYPVNSNTTENIKDIFMVDSLNGYCVGGGSILRSYDGGENWDIIFSDTSMSFNEINNLNDTITFYGVNQNFIKIKVYSNDDISWGIDTLLTYSPIQISTLNNQVYFIDENDNFFKKDSAGIIVNLGLSISNYSLSDTIFIGVFSNLSSIFIMNANDNSFITIPFPSNSPIAVLAYNSPIIKTMDTIVIRGFYPGSVIYTFDLGMNWTFTESGPDISNYIFSPNLIYGFAQNKISISFDYGLSWEVQYITSNNILKFKFSNNNFGFAIGENGTILKTVNFGNQLATNKASLSNKKIKIFPNPTSNILQIENISNIKIKNIILFDLKGILIRTYLDGFYKLDISNIPSGEYVLFIQTETEKFTKKVLIAR